MNPTDPNQFNVPNLPPAPATPPTPAAAASMPPAMAAAPAAAQSQPVAQAPAAMPGTMPSSAAATATTATTAAAATPSTSPQPIILSTPPAPTAAPRIPQPDTPTAVGSNMDSGLEVHENPLSTQATLMISELRDGIVIMKDGSFRAVIACQSINFDLMSETEREGVEYSYQNFLNSLNFTTQILIRSQRVDIGPYIDRLSTIRRNNDNMLLGVLMDDYINFIDMLSQEANIMDKSFFIVVPYYTSADAEQLVNQTKNLFRGFSKKPPEVTRINRETYNKAIDELNNRVETIISGLFQIGIQSVRLGTRELSELYYNFNNPDTAIREPLVDFSKLATTYVRKGDKKDAQSK